MRPHSQIWWGWHSGGGEVSWQLRKYPGADELALPPEPTQLLRPPSFQIHDSRK